MSPSAIIKRPVKQGEVRIYGFDESVTTLEIKKAIMDLTGCNNEEVKIGEITVARNNIYTVRVRCPLGAAIKLDKEERIKLGWTMARMYLLKARLLRCYRCLETGHVASNCKGLFDRSKVCYKCSQYGHLAAKCNAEYFCVICSGNNLTCNHSIGNRSCDFNYITQESNINKNREVNMKKIFNFPNRSNAGLQNEI